jgi:hypothetical protein
MSESQGTHYAVKYEDEVRSILTDEERAEKLAARLSAVNGRSHHVVPATPDEVAAWNAKHNK